MPQQLQCCARVLALATLAACVGSLAALACPLRGLVTGKSGLLLGSLSSLQGRVSRAASPCAGCREEQLRERLGTLEAAGTPRSMRAGRRSPSSTSTGEEEGARPSGATGSSTEGTRYPRGRLCGSPLQVGGDPWCRMCVYVGELASQWMVGSRHNEYVGEVIRENLRTRLTEMQHGGGGHGRGKPAPGSREEVAARLRERSLSRLLKAC